MIFDRVQGGYWVAVDSSFLTISLSVPIRVVNNAEVRCVSLLPVVDEHILNDQVWLRLRRLVGL